MIKRLFISTTLLLLVGLLCFFSISLYTTRSNNLSIATTMVIEMAQNYAWLYDPDADLAFFVETPGLTRVTIIAPDGTMLADSHPLDMAIIANHLDRPEIQAAARGAPTAYTRFSDTVGVDFIYYALQIPSGDSYVFLRASIPVAKIDGYLSHSLPLLILVLIVLASLSFVLSRNMINRIINPFESVERKLRSLSDGSYTAEPIAGSYEEIGNITQGIDEVSRVLQSSIAGLQDEKNKLSYILDNIGDGLVVMDEGENVTLINSAALSIFSVNHDIVGKNLNYLSFDETLKSAVDECVSQEKAAMFELSLNGRIYLIAVKRLPGTVLTMVALSDVTENRENAKRREEFFANASHELKTPLTAIKGFNELAGINNKDEGINRYIDAISRETGRMLTLISDMLKLSELGNTVDLKPVNVSLAKVVDEVREALSPVISEKSINFEAIGDAKISAEQGHVYDLIKNLAENAVRYSNQNGRVSVTIESDKKGAYLFIFDDGIGISPGEQTRIFERFYRVEKSRSQKSGGTGLGLSIVKHVCALYGWKLSLKSKLGVGTEVAITF
ncbi:MAG: ATP-binding protein [Oscillospiraceae bacterium]|nr:ATP-binding protein [Oscillospiraceae bacterium]